MTTDTTMYKEKLEALLAELTAELTSLGINDPNNPNDWIATPEGTGANVADPNVAADRVENWDGRRALVATLETRFNNITKALGKIESNTFGVCEISNCAIEADRLEANPAARTCKAHLDDEAGLSN